MKPPRHVRLLFACASLLTGQMLWAQGEPWMDRAFRGRVPLSNLSPVGAATLTDFPVLIRLTNQAFLQQAALADGGDLSFAGVDGWQFFHEIEDFDRTNGNLTAWVSIPSFTNGTKFFIYYGNAGSSMAFRGSNSTGSLTQAMPTFRSRLVSTNVWDAGFRLVLHFADSTTTPYDSSRYGLTPSRVGTGNIAGSNGRIGPCLSVAVPSQDFTTARVPLKYAYGNFLPIPSQCSVSMWVNCRSPSNFVTSGNYMGLLSYFGAGSGNGIALMRWNHLEQPGMNLFGASASPTTWGNSFNQWNFLAMGGAVVNAGAVTNGTNYSITNGIVAKTNTALTTMNMAYAPTADLTIGGSDPGMAATPGMYDEFRLSHTNRGSAWLLTEYSNAVLADTNLFYALGSAQPGPLMSALSNEVTQPSPYPGSTFRVFLDPATIFVPWRGPNFITQVSWWSTNGNGVGYATNMAYGADTNTYSWTIPFGVGGIFSNFAIIMDLSNGTWTNAPVGIRVFSNANFDLSLLTGISTNRGFVLDLFGSNRAVAQPAAVTIRRDGVAVGPVTLGESRFLDSDGLFYGRTYNYLVTVDYAESSYTNALMLSGNPPALVSVAAQGGGMVLQDFEIKATLPGGAGNDPSGWILARATDRKMNPWVVPVQKAYGEFEIKPPSGVAHGFTSPMEIRYALQVAQGILKLPGWMNEGLAPLFADDALRIVLGFWDGYGWRELPTSVDVLPDRVLVRANHFAGGRLGLLLREGKATEAPRGPFLASRVLLPGSEDPFRNRFSLSFQRAHSEAVSFRVFSDRGRPVFEDRAVAGNQVAWDMIWDGKPLPPGIYLYALKIGTGPGSESRGTFVVSP